MKLYPHTMHGNSVANPYYCKRTFCIHAPVNCSSTTPPTCTFSCTFAYPSLPQLSACSLINCPFTLSLQLHIFCSIFPASSLLLYHSCFLHRVFFPASVVLRLASFFSLASPVHFLFFCFFSSVATLQILFSCSTFLALSVAIVHFSFSFHFFSFYFSSSSLFPLFLVPLSSSRAL